ncbi:MAG: hypothetical protein N4A62_19890 [Marinisporobacter sp.]|nr:hypothetical protein [Marinisporobacter sp.]
MEFVSEALQAMRSIKHNLDQNLLVSKILSIKSHDKNVYFFYLWNEHNHKIKVFSHEEEKKVNISIIFTFNGQVMDKKFKIGKLIHVNEIMNFIYKILNYYELRIELRKYKYEDYDLMQKNMKVKSI